MRLGLNLAYSGARISDEVRRAEQAEQLGYDSVWASEAWMRTPSHCWPGSPLVLHE
jgi:alkanesulfonate monooxygenase SsuD/methylene tetrahydromethanopterin reductase-like flavin-dependent oxidoreductase (luciferase family)